jgi:hypothetical protein
MRSELSGARLSVDGLTVSAIVYLVLPNLIFVFGWLQTAFSIASCAVLLFFLRELLSTSSRWPTGYSRPAFALIIFSALVWAAFGGGSHFMYANSDWVVRDAVLGDLISKPWPVHYLSPEGTQLILRSAIGYFLPPALFGKIFGTEYLDVAIFFWTAAGTAIFLLLLPLKRQIGIPLASGILLAVFFSGMDFIGQIVSTQSLPMFPLRLEWWGPLSYPSLCVQLLWAPNHCLPIWIATLLVVRYWESPHFVNLAAAVLPLSLIWTPFAALGLMPFALFGTIRQIRSFGSHTMPWTSIGAAAIFSLPICLFLLLDVGHIEAGTINQAVGAGSHASPSVSLNQYMTFVACEFLLLALVLLPLIKQRKDMFWLALSILLLLPFFGYGPSNDSLLRLCAPPLIIMLVTCLETLCVDVKPSHQPTRWIAWIFLAIGAHSGFNELWRAASYHRWKPDYSISLTQQQHGRPAFHYAGAIDHSPMQSLLKPLQEDNRPATEQSTP